jgi:hypothetical protein
MDQHITREILWNIPARFDVFLYGMLIPLTAAFIYAGLRWYRIITDRRDRPATALRSACASPLHVVSRQGQAGVRGP